MQWLIDIIIESVLSRMSGIISQWHGLIADIPDGWIICDGNNGTPNLLGRFILGTTIDGAMGVTGGASVHNHPFTSNTHHHHTNAEFTADNIDDGSELVGTAQGPPATSDDTVSGTTDAGNNLPPYYYIGFIMKT